MAVPSRVDAEGIAVALAPLPSHCLGLLLSAHSQYPTKGRNVAICKALATTQGLRVQEEDIQFVFDKLSKYMPAMLHVVPPPEEQADVVISALIHQCPTCLP